ncbi:MAG: M67 family metallopeptidase [Candidatus Promineifilaceae bacterium]
MLKIDKQLKEKIESHGITSYPFEGCGLLLGKQVGSDNGDVDNVVTSIFPVANSWEVEEEKPERFLISPADMLQAELAAASQGLDIVGIFHSHPDHPPIASPRDVAWAAWSGHSYLITEIRQGQPRQSRSWQLLPDRSGFEEEIVEFV